MKRVWRLRKSETILGKVTLITQDEKRKKQLELRIAKKMYEVEILKIEMKYPECKTDTCKIWFKI